MVPSDDAHRYLWEAKVWQLGFNPYRLAPDAPLLAPFRDGHWARMNHRDLPAIYPPLAQAFFYCLHAFSPTILACKLAWSLLDLGSARLARSLGGDRAAALLFLNPLLIFEGAGLARYESLPLLASLLFLLAIRKHHFSGSIAAWVAGALAKYASAALAPLWFLNWKPARAAAAAALAGSLAAGALALAGTGSLSAFAGGYKYNAILPYFLDRAGAVLGWPGAAAAAPYLGMAAAAWGCWRLRDAGPERQGLFLMGLPLLVLPTVHPWYALWPLPFAALRAAAPWLLLTGTIFIAHYVDHRALAAGAWAEIPWLRWPEYAPPLALWIWTWTRSRIRASG